MCIDAEFLEDLEALPREILFSVLAGKNQFEIAEKLSRSATDIEAHLGELQQRAYDAGMLGLADRFRAASAIADQTTAVAEVAAVVSPQRILLVEDHPVIRILLQLLIEPLGVELQTAWDGVEAVQRIWDSGFDLVIMDIDMPRMNGLEATRAIRALERRRGDRPVPIAMLTSHESARQRRLASEAGADAYLTKPIEPAELFAVIDQYLSAADADRPARGL